MPALLFKSMNNNIRTLPMYSTPLQVVGFLKSQFDFTKLNDYRLKPVGCDGRERLFRLKSVKLADQSA
jgi:hypothetical protein